jgi:flavin reductase (DIM6/NTAB) family NADH-FMN oxidoreductase RutF
MTACCIDERPPSIAESRELRSCLGRFATGVTVVTTLADGGPHGLTVNTFSSVSLDPPLVLIAVARTARADRLLSARPFAVNVLAAGQEQLARHFGGTPVEGIEIEWEDGRVAPRLRTSLAAVECVPWRRYDGGDNTIHVGRVVAFDYSGGPALVFYCSRFTGVLPGLEPHR